MTAFRLLSLPTHAALELAVGLGLMAAPFVLGVSAAGIVTAVAVGALLAGLALSAATNEGTSLPVSSHFAFDRAIALALLGSAAVLGLSGDRAAAAVLAAAALAQGALNITTRYTAAH